jgi:hypothetical protein
VEPRIPQPRIVGSISNDPLVPNPPGTALIPIVDVTNKATTLDDVRGSTARTIQQGSHGFTSGMALHNNGGTWMKSKADSITTARVDGVVSPHNLSAGSFVAVTGGALTTSPWTPNAQYYLSDSVAGLLTPTAPTALTSFLVPVARAGTATSAIVNIGEPLSLAKIPDSALENPGGGTGGSGSVSTGMVAMFPRASIGSLPAGWIECNGAHGTTDEADVGAMAVVMKHGGTVATPMFSPAAGSYATSQTVTISCATAGVVIKYTTDGSTPSRLVGATYTVPINIGVGSTNLKAVAYRVPTDPTLTMIDSGQQIGAYTIAVADTTPPIITSAVIPSAGNTLVMAFNEVVVANFIGGVTLAMSGGAVTATYSSGTGTNTLTYALNRPIAAGETGTASYTQPGDGIEDLAGNDLASFSGFALTNNSTVTPDVTPPTYVTSVIPPAGNTLLVFMSEAVYVGAGGPLGFTLAMSGGAVTITGIMASSNQITLSLSRLILAGETGTFSYAQPGNGIEDFAGNDFASLSAEPITNNNSTQVAGDVTPPTVTSVTIPTTGGTVNIAMSEAIVFGAGVGEFTLTMSGGPVTLVTKSGVGTAMLTYTLSRPIAVGETGTASYTQPGDGIQDPAGNDLATVSGMAVINNSTVPGGGGGGTPGWIYNVAGTALDTSSTFDESSSQWQRITAGYTGNVDKVSLRQQYVNAAGHTIKAALVSGDGTTVLGTGSWTSDGFHEDEDIEITLLTPAAVVNGQSYLVMFSFSSNLIGGAKNNFAATPGTESGVNYGYAFADFPEVPLVDVGGARYRVGLHQV